MIYLGIDCGTQSLKILAWNPETKAAQSASSAYGLIDGLPPGHKEQHPQVWIDALKVCVQALKKQGVDFESVRAIGVSGQQHGLVVLDSKDQVIRPAKLWNDTSTQPQCRQIVDRAGGIESYREEIGNSLPPGFTASKILWIKQKEPAAYERIDSIMLPHDYLNFYLTGEKTAESGDASGTGYFQVREKAWSKKALGWIDPDSDLETKLPRLVPSQEPIGTVRAELAREWGLPPGVKVSSGGGDNMMGAIGSGNVTPGLMTVSLGTSGTLYSYSDSPVIDPTGDIAAFCDSTGAWLPLGCTMNVTVATEMIRTGFLSMNHEDFNAAISRIPAGSEGLLLLPYLEGERMPAVPLGTGMLMGLRPATSTAGHLARAAMEGVTFGLRYGLERMRGLGCAPTEVRLIGGGAKSPVWRQMVADIFNVSVVCPKGEEGPAFGAALQAAWADQGSSIRDLTSECVEVDEQTRHAADSKVQEIYNRGYELYSQFSSYMTESGLFACHRNLIEN